MTGSASDPTRRGSAPLRFRPGDGHQQAWGSGFGVRVGGAVGLWPGLGAGLGLGLCVVVGLGSRTG